MDATTLSFNEIVFSTLDADLSLNFSPPPPITSTHSHSHSRSRSDATSPPGFLRKLKSRAWMGACGIGAENPCSSIYGVPPLPYSGVHTPPPREKRRAYTHSRSFSTSHTAGSSDQILKRSLSKQFKLPSRFSSQKSKSSSSLSSANRPQPQIPSTPTRKKPHPHPSSKKSLSLRIRTHSISISPPSPAPSSSVGCSPDSNPVRDDFFGPGDDDGLRWGWERPRRAPGLPGEVSLTFFGRGLWIMDSNSVLLNY
jgi:hypothetical protein